MNWFQRLALKFLRLPSPATDPIPRNATEMTLGQWRKEEKLVEHSMNLRRNRIYMSQLDVLRVHHPGHVVNAVNAPAERTLGRVEGFQLCLDMLDSFAIPVVTRPAEEATFEPEPESK